MNFFQLVWLMELCMQKVPPCIHLDSVTTVTVSEGINSACSHSVFWCWRAAHLDTQHSPAVQHTTTVVSSTSLTSSLSFLFMLQIYVKCCFEKHSYFYICVSSQIRHWQQNPYILTNLQKCYYLNRNIQIHALKLQLL
jgi:hypothetical protein